jgi:DNA-binding IclR family transcriptional regulator
MLQYRARGIIERIAANSSQIGALAAPVRGANGEVAKTGRSLPRRRPAASS